MMTWQTARQHVTRTALLSLLVASLAFAAVQGSGAAQTPDESHRNTVTEIQVCEAMGGEAIVDVVRTGNGEFASRVRCIGGALDGMDCTNGRYGGTECDFARFGRDHDVTVPDLDAIAPLDERAKDPDTDAADEPVTLAPIEEATVVVDAPVSPTPTPETEAGLDPADAGPVVTDGEKAPEATATPSGDVDTGPVVDERPMIDEMGGRGEVKEPILIEPQIEVEDIAPVEPVILT